MMKPKTTRNVAKTTEERVLLVATRFFAEQGYRGTNVRAICEQAGANLGAVNYHFGSKEELYGQVVRTLAADLSENMRDLHLRATDAASWEDALRTWIHLYLDILLTEREPGRWLAQIYSRELADPTPAGGYLFANFFAPVIEELRTLLHKGLSTDATFEQGQVYVISVLGQCTLMAFQQPPWNRLVIPESMSKEDWLTLYGDQVLRSITATLSFRPSLPS